MQKFIREFDRPCWCGHHRLAHWPDPDGFLMYAERERDEARAGIQRVDAAWSRRWFTFQVDETRAERDRLRAALEDIVATPYSHRYAAVILDRAYAALGRE